MAIKLVRNILVKMGFMRHPTVMALQPKIAFYIDAAAHGSHGQIVVTNHAYNLKEQAVNFSFIGRRDPPAMSLEVITELWKQAAEQGYFPIRIESYGKPTLENKVAMSDKITWDEAKAFLQMPRPWPSVDAVPPPELADHPGFNPMFRPRYGTPGHYGLDTEFPRADANYSVMAQAIDETQPATPETTELGVSGSQGNDPAVFSSNRESVND